QAHGILVGGDPMYQAHRGVLSGRRTSVHLPTTTSIASMLHRAKHPHGASVGVRLTRYVLIASAIFAGAVSAQKPSFTIESALSAPFPSGLTAAPAGGRVAWIFDAQGSRNIWVGEPSGSGSFTSRQLTNYPGDLGVEIEDLEWSFDGQTIVFIRGGEA